MTSEVDLKINVTWPVRLSLCIQVNCHMEIEAEAKAIEENNRIKIDDCFGEGNRVCDEDKYRIRGRTNGIDFWQPHLPRLLSENICSLGCCGSYASFEQTLIVLLESPHTKEYLNNCIDQPIAPARGTTGCRIRCYLPDIIQSCQDIQGRIGDRSTRVILANPIQFQCSLVSIMKFTPHKEWKIARNAVWKALWDCQDIRYEFKRRLEGYRPDFIINACTHEKARSCGCMSRNRSLGDDECRKRKVSDFLGANFPCANIYQAGIGSSCVLGTTPTSLVHAAPAPTCLD